MACGELRHLVLLVDDDARTARLLAKMLREDGFDVEVLTDGRAAFDRVGQPPAPQALVTEWVLPNVDGLAVARQARRGSPSLPIVIVTGYPQLAAKATDLAPRPCVLTKPVEYSDVLHELRTAIESAP